MGGDAIAADMTQRIAQVRDAANANSIAHSKDVRLDRDKRSRLTSRIRASRWARYTRYLRSWLGRRTASPTELREAGDGKIALTVALDGRTPRLRWARGDLDKLEQQAAEHVFQIVDPSNYILYLFGTHRHADALPAIQHLIHLADSPGMLADGYSLWGNWTRTVAGNLPLAMMRLRMAAAIDAKALPPHMEMMFTSLDMGQDEIALHEARALADFRQEDQYAWREGKASPGSPGWRSASDAETGDFQRATSDRCEGMCSLIELLLDRAEYAARMHDVSRSRVLIKTSMASVGVGADDADRARYFADAAADDWPSAVADARSDVEAKSAERSPLSDITMRTNTLPLLAYALAQIGDFRQRMRRSTKRPAIVSPAKRRGETSMGSRRKWSSAAWWFARATRDAPSIPFAYTDWGAMLLAKGDLDGAIAKFRLANRERPAFCRPIGNVG